MWRGPPWDYGVCKCGAVRPAPSEVGWDIPVWELWWGRRDHLGLGVRSTPQAARGPGRRHLHQPAASRGAGLGCPSPAAGPWAAAGFRGRRRWPERQPAFLRAPGSLSAQAGPARVDSARIGPRDPRPPTAHLRGVPSSRERFLPRLQIQAAGPAVKTGGVSFILAHRVPKGNRGP